MELKNKYNWQKLPNERYAIFNIPIFKTFDNEKGKLTENDAYRILKNFKADQEKGYYPRVHIEHQENISRPGAGFLDNITYTNQEFFADIVEIPKKIFQEVQNLKYPYRSVEYDAAEKKLVSLAFLESQAPFFQFPILALSEQEQENELSKFQKRLYKRRQIFMKGKNMLEDEKMEDEKTEDEKTEEVETEKTDIEGTIEEKVEKLIEIITPLISSIEKIMTFISSLEEGERKEGDIPGGNKPEPVVMQKFQKQIENLENKIINLENKKVDSVLEDSLKMVCENGNLNFQSEFRILEKFSTFQDKKLYLERLEVQSKNQPIHTMTRFAKNYRVSSRNTILEKYKDDSFGVQKIAKMAYKDYNDTINQVNEKAAKQFVASWEKVENFVKYAVDLEKEEDGAYKKEFGKN